MFKFLLSRRPSKYFIAWEYIDVRAEKIIKDSTVFELYPEKLNTVAIREWISYSYMAINGEDVPSNSITITAMSKL